MAYARALQHWAEQNNLPARGEPRLLARSVLELREEVRWYLSFTDEEVFWGMALPEEEEEESLQTPGPTNFPEAPCMPEPVLERRALKFAGWEKVLHPARPVVGHQRYPSTDQDPKAKGGSKTDPLDDIYKATSLPYSTSTLTIDAVLGTCTTANPTTRLLWSNSLFMCSRVGRSGA